MLARLIYGNSLRRAPQWLALLAMLVQFVASYGHIHPEDFNFLKHGHAPLTLAASDRSGSSHSDGMAADTDCPICTLMALLGSAALPEGVRLPVPSLHSSTFLASLDALYLTPPAHLLFNTRGPPVR